MPGILSQPQSSRGTSLATEVKVESSVESEDVIITKRMKHSKAPPTTLATPFAEPLFTSPQLCGSSPGLHLSNCSSHEWPSVTSEWTRAGISPRLCGLEVRRPVTGRWMQGYVGLGYTGIWGGWIQRH